MNLALRVNLKMLKLQLARTTKKIDDIKANCRHTIVDRNTIARCEDCETTFGWWCSGAPNHYCDYGTSPKIKRNCLYCGEYSERK